MRDEMHDKSWWYTPSVMICQVCDLDKKSDKAYLVGFLAYPNGFEPSTFRVGVWRAIQLCHGQMQNAILQWIAFGMNWLTPWIVNTWIALRCIERQFNSWHKVSIHGAKREFMKQGFNSFMYYYPKSFTWFSAVLNYTTKILFCK